MRHCSAKTCIYFSGATRQDANYCGNLNITLDRDKELVDPLSEPERFFQRKRRTTASKNLIHKLNLAENHDLEGEVLPEELPAAMAARIVRDVAVPLTANVTSSIQKPPAGGRFELKQNMVQLLYSNGQFTGLTHEDPKVHIQNFLEISDTYTPIGVSPDYVRLTLFPFSLIGEAKRWLKSEPPNSITSWNDLARKFLIRFFPSGKTAKLRAEILSFKQKLGENLYQSWDRFKSLLISCPHHYQANEVLVHTFIEGLEPNTKIFLDSAAGGQALDKTYDELYTLLNRISQGNPEWNGGNARSVTQKQAGMLEVDAVTALTAQIAAMQNMMTTHFNTLAKGQQQASVSMVQQQLMWCEVCGSSEHVAEHCGANPESINFVGNAPKGIGNQNYGNTYNPNWRNHPNFSWGGNQQNHHHEPTQYRPQGSGHQYNNPSQAYNAQSQNDQASTKSGSMSVEDMLKQIMTDQAKLASDVRQNQLATQNLEKQLGQLASAHSSRQQGGLPGNTDPNPKQVNVVTTRSGRPLTELAPKVKLAEEKGKEQGIPRYAKFVKDIVANKSKLAEFATVALTEECSSRILNKSKLPAKLKDPGSFTVQVTIGKYSNARDLCDLGASINLMPRSMLKKLGLGELKATTILLQLADRSVARPDGIIEDVLVQVGSLIFPVDFVILDFEPDPDVPFILGRPFLATGGALIDMAAGRLTMRAHDKVEVFDVYHALKLPAIYKELSAVTIIDEEISAQCTTSNDPLAKVVMGQDIAEDMEAK
ncbi:uncharacterized protein LOC129892666 [Solanum dulcamara]|uniref:uncharacterized protein LOC129892666 n=1 Tax=Solanum dulcamara TaxID=45834 RepID=UPI00248584CA|nr:uncharacterized protein LOC129892666 [Solanum dulcamara]